ncbi:unnamed protein product [Fraxinus pennsylvanica]|uniref:RING-type E3 ubiquitin transferase n=1 Tax=Fraxinus pennsylvanica TaxID=56036 RepID=A0AAD2AKY1_9LAMI|nr:unnamed protein product [Fraxinus pennsylvanica]
MQENYMDYLPRMSWTGYRPRSSARPIQDREETERYLMYSDQTSLVSVDSTVVSDEMIAPHPIQVSAVRGLRHSDQTGIGSDNHLVIFDDFFPTFRGVIQNYSRETSFSEETDSDDDGVMFDEFPNEMGELDWYGSSTHIGFSEETIRQHLKTRNFVNIEAENAIDESPEVCVVCQCEYEKNENVGSLVCGHEYHVDCIKKWLSQETCCPICRAKAF